MEYTAFPIKVKPSYDEKRKPWYPFECSEADNEEAVGNFDGRKVKRTTKDDYCRSVSNYDENERLLAQMETNFVDQ